MNRLLLHLPGTKNSLRRALVPVIDRKELLICEPTPLVKLRYNKVHRGKFGNQNVAIKTVPWIRSDLAWNEVEMLSLLTKHPYVLDFIGIAHDREENSLLVVTELVLPETLDFHVTQHDNKLDFRWLTQIASAVAHLHSQDIVHRDLKAGNVLLSVDTLNKYVAKLADFDRAAMLKENQVFEEPCGSLFHMAPELLCGKKYNHKIDVYAFGILMFEVAHQSLPYPGLIGPGLPGTLTEDHFALKVINEGLRPKWTYDDPNLKRLAERCWALEPNDRPEFEEIVETLQRDFPLDQHDKTDFFASRLKTKNESLLPNIIGSSASIGRVRKTMEDSLAILLSSNHLICGVFDGLKSYRTSEFSARYFPMDILEKLRNKRNDDEISILRKCFEDVNQTLKEVVPPIECGSTATAALISSNRITVGWLGDSSSYLFRRIPEKENHYEAVSLINKHSPDRPDELARIDKSQGAVARETVWLDNGEKMPIGPWRAFAKSLSEEKSQVGIAISRSLGLFQFNSVISNEGEFVSFERQPNDSFLIMASDGLWDLVDLNQILQAMREAKHNPQRATELLIQKVLDLGAHDNVSIIIVKLDDLKL